MKALISGSTATAVVYEKKGIFALLLEQGSRWRRVREFEVPFLFHSATDVTSIRAEKRREVLDALRAEQAQHDALQLLLLLLLRSTSDENREGIARWLEGALRDRRVARFLENRLHIAPVPDALGYRRALGVARGIAGRRADGRLVRLLEEVKRRQAPISLVSEAWGYATRDLQASAELRLRRRVSVAGGFRQAVAALLSGDPERFDFWVGRLLRRSKEWNALAPGGAEAVRRWSTLLDVRRQQDFITRWLTGKLQHYLLIEPAPLKPLAKSLLNLRMEGESPRSQASYNALLSLQLRSFLRAPTPRGLLRCASIENLPSSLVDDALRNVWMVRSEALAREKRGVVLPWTSPSPPNLVYRIGGEDGWELFDGSSPPPFESAVSGRPGSVDPWSQALSVEGRPAFRLKDRGDCGALQRLDRISFEFASGAGRPVASRSRKRRPGAARGGG